MNGNIRIDISKSKSKFWMKKNIKDIKYTNVKTMKKNKYPDYVQSYIKNKWIKKSNYHGGSYYRDDYYKKILNEFSYFET